VAVGARRALGARVGTAALRVRGGRSLLAVAAAPARPASGARPRPPCR
jgi:hypothetical protein